VRHGLAAVGTAELVEPPQAQLRQERTLAGDAGGEHVVERAHPVGRHNEHPVIRPVLGSVQIAHLPGVHVRPAGDLARLAHALHYPGRRRDARTGRTRGDPARAARAHCRANTAGWARKPPSYSSAAGAASAGMSKTSTPWSVLPGLISSYRELPSM